MRVAQCRFTNIGDSARSKHWKIAESKIQVLLKTVLLFVHFQHSNYITHKGQRAACESNQKMFTVGLKGVFSCKRK